MSRGGTLVEEEEEVEMLVTLSGDGAIVRRSGRFLRPRATSLYEAAAELLLEWPPKVLFRGWRLPQAKWGQWVEKLKPIYRNLWKKARIYDAIMASVCGIRRDSAAIFALLECWCPETSTFVLPWGEVTLTLEDVTVLGGSPFRGEEILGKMVEEHKGFRRRSAKKAFHYDWMNFYMAGATGGAAGDQAEHLAFLSLWLSRYVFPSRPYDTVARRVFPIAVRLAQGRKVALAPAVLAAIYRDLRELKQHAVLQLWVWERFISLRPEQRPHFLHWDEPRAARWHCLDQKSKLTLVRSVLESPDEFQWRPYTTNLDDWGHPSFYKDGGEWAVVGSGPAMDDGDGISLFARFLRPCELVGLDCIEPYSPQRVAMQFGLDQDLPGRLPTYDGGAMEELEVYAPPRLLESDVTRRFYDWQRHCAVARSEAWRSALFQQKRLWQMKQEELFDVNR
ncbi:unnamed protein product [Spirodela intermedia]|uniref:Aminotransferase-like plant mobile domain-containing protein n=1 Tax=Spirodela intermedia TaxID=51605 RepID=A0A7I8II56_SPIIN|nr:unnamed protein product [Spirodela intermedia]CAA6656562.1 unnamed protein product [Spirodela intermedia]